MRSLSIAALVLAAFALGLAFGGRTPREASAAPTPALSKLEWKNAGGKMVFTNRETNAGYVVLGQLRSGAKAPVPAPSSASETGLGTTDFEHFTVYRIEAILACDPRECRKCQPGGLFACPAPPPIPISPRQFQVNLAPRQIPR